MDVFYAQRPISRDLLARSRASAAGDLDFDVVPLEGLIGLKVQAISDDPRRIIDLTDIIELMKIHRTDMDFDEVRRYFRLFDRENWLDDILRVLG
ncbi:MAG TPA: hypothetical protein VJ696_00345 [Rhodanobacteraceae bacterium]|nr:hypothetical protein [Rhodanobacteraceae bacterium]